MPTSLVEKCMRWVFPTLLLAVACDTKDGLVVHTDPPVITISNPTDGATLDEGVTVELLGLIRDDRYDDSLDSISVHWAVNSAQVCADAVVSPSGETTCDHIFNGEGEATITLSATNPDSETAGDSVVVNVLQNGAPSAEILDPGTLGAYYSDHLISFEGAVSDGEDPAEALVVGWESSIDGALDLPVNPTGDGAVSGALLLSAGEHFITLTVEDSTGRTGQDSVTIGVGGPNNLPQCEITAPASGGAFSEGDDVAFIATASDADIAATELSALWSSDQDGDLGNSSVPSDGEINFSTSDLTVGTHTISLTVTDEVGEACTDTIIVQIGDQPFVDLTAPVNGDRFNEGDGVLFSALIEDANDDLDTLEMSWVSSLQGEISTQGPNSSGEASFNTNALARGTHTITVTATDPLGFAGSDNASITINGLPSAPTVSIDPDPAGADDDLRAVIDVEAVDPEGDSVSYTYAWYRNSSLEAGYTGDLINASATTRGDTWEVVVTPNDGDGDGETGSASVTLGNSPPVILDVDLTPNPPAVDDELVCAPGITTDGDGDSVAYQYAWSRNGATESGASGDTWSPSGMETGETFMCTVTPYDGTDFGDPVDSNTIEVGNSPPSVETATLTPTTAYEDTTLTCTVGATSDPDGDSVNVSYAWYLGGIAIPSAADTTLDGAEFDRDDTIFCRVTPDDGTTTGDSVDSNSVTILNSTPSLDSASLSPDPVYTDDTITCNPGTASDTDGDTITYSYSWEVSGVGLSATGSSLASTWFAKDDVVVCLVNPTDGTDDGAVVSTDPLVVSNTPPEVSSVSITPGTPTSNDELTATPSGWSDADGDDAGYVYAWYVNSAEVSGVTDSTLDAVYIESGDTVYVVATPDDGDDTGASVTSSSVIVGNSPPILESAGLTPSTAYETTTLACSPGDGGDPDGDALSYTYSWEVSGASISHTGATLDGASFDKHDTVMCSVTPYDGEDYGDAADSNEVEILNAPPSTTTPSVTPDPAYTNSTVSCAAGATADDDSDSVSVSYGWQVSGVDTGASGSSLASSYFNKGDTVVCLVTPNDGEDDGPAASSATLIISNTAPSGTSVSIVPSTAYTDDDLEAQPAGWSDIDGDTEGWLYDWFVNGVSVGSSATLSSSSFIRTDVIRVEATPYDGADTGTTVISSSITILNSTPSAPTISISPSAPGPDDNLTCNIATASVDLDGDTLSYTYAWTVDGLTSSVVSSTIPASDTSHGDTWNCEVYATDGLANSSTVSASVNITDDDDPDPPILGALTAYRNEDSATIDGTCEANSDLTWYFSDGGGSWVEYSTCSGSGAASHFVYLARGSTTSVYATSTDSAANTSGNSNTVSTEACDPWDERENSSGYGDSYSSAINEWTAFVDASVDSATIVGNALESSDEDWYLVSAEDNPDNENIYYIETFNFEIVLAEGVDTYEIEIYQTSDVSVPYCSTDTTEFDFFYDEEIYGYSEFRYCYPGVNHVSYTDCADFTSDWYIKVTRRGDADDSCDHYEIDVSNGIW